MENIGERWQSDLAARLGAAVLARRKAQNLTALGLSDRCAELGAPIHRTTITKIENGRARFDLGELIVLAAALDTSPAALLLGDQLMDGEIELLPGVTVSAGDALLWFGGERSIYSDEPPIFFGTEPAEDERQRRSAEYQSAMQYMEANYPLALVRRFHDAKNLIDEGRDAWNDTDAAGREIIKPILKDAVRDMADSKRDMQRAGMIVDSKEVRLTFDGEDG